LKCKSQKRETMALKSYDDIKEGQILYTAKETVFWDSAIESEEPDGNLESFTKLLVSECKNSVILLEVLEGEFLGRYQAIYWWGEGAAVPEDYITQEEYDLQKGNIPPVNEDNYWEVSHNLLGALAGMKREQFKQLIVHLTGKALVANPFKAYEPNYAIPPGETISELMEEKHRTEWTPGEVLSEVMQDYQMTKSSVAQALGLTEDDFLKLLEGDMLLTKEIADKLALVFKVGASFWVNLENNYRNTLERLSKNE
jgi:plasmid maintenance system antidote protein VapI